MKTTILLLNSFVNKNKLLLINDLKQGIQSKNSDIRDCLKYLLKPFSISKVFQALLFIMTENDI